MLTLLKNKVVTNVQGSQVDIQQREISWYTGNLFTIAGQCGIMAGFSMEQFTVKTSNVNFFLQALYLACISLSTGMLTCGIITATFAGIWGKGLALRGPEGLKSVHKATHNLRIQQRRMYAYFIIGLILFLASHIVYTKISHGGYIHTATVFILGFFFSLILLVCVCLTRILRVDDEEAIDSRMYTLQGYEGIEDLDQRIYSGEYAPAVEHDGFRAMLHPPSINPTLKEGQGGKGITPKRFADDPDLNPDLVAATSFNKSATGEPDPTTLQGRAVQFNNYLDKIISR